MCLECGCGDLTALVCPECGGRVILIDGEPKCLSCGVMPSLEAASAAHEHQHHQQHHHHHHHTEHMDGHTHENVDEHKHDEAVSEVHRGNLRFSVPFSA